MDDRKLVAGPWPAAVWCILPYPNFLHSEEALICTSVSGEFMCYWRANGCTETVSFQGCILTPFLSTWSFEKEKYQDLSHISFDISRQDAAMCQIHVCFHKELCKKKPSLPLSIQCQQLFWNSFSSSAIPQLFCSWKRALGHYLPCQLKNTALQTALEINVAAILEILST